jgi:hypothetical protein
MKRFASITGLLCALTSTATAQGRDNRWLLPNLDMRLNIEVSNPGKEPVRTLATISVSEARKVAPEFPGRLAFVLQLNKDGASRAASFLPSQADDLDGDGTPDQFEFPVELAPGERREVEVYYSTKLSDPISYPKLVHAKHTYGYNREVAAIESEIIGYRTYGGFFLDFMGRSAGLPGLNNDLAGYVSVHLDLGAGRDVFHIGKTLGLGGVFLRRNGKVWQPPMNMPTYAHKPSPAVVPHYRVVSQGPLRAIVEATLDDWAPEEDVIQLRARYSIDAGTSYVQCHLEAIPVKMAAGRAYEIGVGLRDLPDGSIADTSEQVIVTGRQNPRDGDIGLGLFYKPQAFEPLTSVRTDDGGNHALILRTRLTAGQAVAATYDVSGAWSGSGIKDIKEFLTGVGHSAAARVDTGNFRFSTTPRPDKIEAEAQ